MKLNVDEFAGWSDKTNFSEERAGKWKERCQKLAADNGKIDKVIFHIDTNILQGKNTSALKTLTQARSILMKLCHYSRGRKVIKSCDDLHVL